jgi:hypothetical protein
MNEPEKPKKGWGWLQWVATSTVFILLSALGTSLARYILDEAQSSQCGQNGRQILFSLKIWAHEFEGKFPDSRLGKGATANGAFRQLIKDAVVLDETIFGAPQSAFSPDGKIGTRPDFPQALEPGENHWMLVGGLATNSPGHTPVFFENAIDATWPPKWTSSFFISKQRGRAWRTGRIMMFFVDNSAHFIELEKTGKLLTLPSKFLSGAGGRTLPPLRILDIEEKK